MRVVHYGYRESDAGMDSSALEGFYTQSQRSRFYAAVSQRRSVRAFMAPPDVAQLSALAFSAQRLALPGVRMELGECEDKKLYRSMPFVDTIVGSGRYVALIVDRQAPDAALYAGVSGEALVLEAVSLGLGTCWVGGTYRKSAVQTPLKDGEYLAAIIALGVPARERHVKRAPRKKLTDICLSDPTGWPMWAFNAAECLRMAPSALNRQPWRLSFSGRTIQLEKTAFAGTLDMGIALLHLSLGVGDREHLIRLCGGHPVATLYSEDVNEPV